MSHLDHVGAGTIEADVYSFAIIVVELMTGDIPYAEQLECFDVTDVLRAIAGLKSSLTNQVPQVLIVCVWSCMYVHTCIGCTLETLLLAKCPLQFSSLFLILLGMDQ